MAKKTIVGELKYLFTKMGGNVSTLKGNETTSEMLNAIEQVYHESGSTLPNVTTDDNGKVLTVVEGEWNKATLHDNLFIATYTNDSGTMTCDKTFDEIATAIKTGKRIIAKTAMGMGNNKMEVICQHNVTVTSDENITGVGFSGILVSELDHTLTVMNIAHNNDETATQNTFVVTQS